MWWRILIYERDSLDSNIIGTRWKTNPLSRKSIFQLRCREYFDTLRFCTISLVVTRFGLVSLYKYNSVFNKHHHRHRNASTIFLRSLGIAVGVSPTQETMRVCYLLFHGHFPKVLSSLWCSTLKYIATYLKWI